MSNLRTKVAADLRQHRGRNLLTIVSIAIGVIYLGTILGLIELLLSQMDQAHQFANPAHIQIMLRDTLPRSFVTQIKALDDIEGIDLQAQTTVRFRKVGDSTWQLAIIITRPDFTQQQYDISRLQQGAWPNGTGLAVESSSSAYFGLPLQTALEFETTQGSLETYLTGSVRHPFVKPPRFGGQAIFFSDAATAQQFGIPNNGANQLLLRIKPPYSQDKARQVAASVNGLLASQGYYVGATLLQDPQRHWGRVFFVGINQVLQGMAWASLALAGVLVFNSIAAHMLEQASEIGVMKAIGASHGQIALVYLLEVLVMALGGVLLAIPVSLMLTDLSASALLQVFNIDTPKFLYAPRAMALMVLAGILLPVLAALPAIIKASRQTIRSALDSFGLGNDFKVTAFDRQLEYHIGRHLPLLQAAALGNVFRKKIRLLWTQAVLIIAGVLFLVVLSLKASIELTLDHELARSHFDLRLGFPTDQAIESLDTMLRSESQIKTVEYWQRAPLQLFDKSERLVQPKGSLGLQLLALPAASQVYRPYLESGRWFGPEDSAQPVIALSFDTAKRNGIKLGDWLNVQLAGTSHACQVIGIYRWLAGENFVVEPVYAPQEAVAEWLPRKNYAAYAVLSAAVNTLADEQALVIALQERFWQEGLKLDILSTVAKRQQRQHAAQQYRPITGMLLGMASMIAAIAAIGLAGMLLTAVAQRKREIAVLRTIGAEDRNVFHMFMLEGLLNGLLSWIISMPLAYAIAQPVAVALGQSLFGVQLDYSYYYPGVIIWLVGILLLSLLAAWWPSRQALKITVREGLGG